MDKKELRKQLETTLVKALEDVLSKKNPGAAKKIGGTIQDAGKKVAKKFYKSIKAKPAGKPKAPVAAKAKSKTKAKTAKPSRKAKSKK